MPLWSVGEWRARIGSSWCALGRTFKTRSPFRGVERGRGGRGWGELTRLKAVTMIIILMVFIGINFGLQTLVSSGWHHSLKSYFELDDSSLRKLYLINCFEFDDSSLLQKLYLINCGLVVTLIFPITKYASQLVYRSLTRSFKSTLSQFRCGLLWYSLVAHCFIIRWVIHPTLLVITPLIADSIISLVVCCRCLLDYVRFSGCIIHWLILLVLHTLDWQRALSNVMKTVATTKLKTSLDVNDDKTTLLASAKDVLMYALVLMNALLDAFLSVAASVVFSRLLISGDIESNPGPGRYSDLDYHSVDADQILDKDDVTDALEEVLTIKAVYFPLGKCLRLETDDLKAVREAYADESMADQALEDVLLLWLNQKYRVDKYGPPTWRMLVEAVDKKTGGDNHELAKEIASNHPKALTPDNMKEMLDLTWDYRSRWRLIGIQIGIDIGTLDALEKDHKKAEDCLTGLISHWLRGRSPRPTRIAMAKALHSSPVADGAGSTKTTASDDVTLDSPIIDRLENYSGYLKSLYLSKSLASSFSEDQWPPSLTKKVFRLSMVKVEQLRMKNMQDEFLRQKTISGKVDDNLQRSTTIELKDVFQECDDQPKLALIDGAPGSGKSTLSSQICHLWSEGELFQEYKLVILVRLRDPGVQNATSITDLLPCRDETMARDVEILIRENNGKDVLFVLDGWDEIRETSPGHGLILSLIQKKQLHESSIIITSRPTSSAVLHPLVSCRIEILGFTKEELRRYFSDCLQNTRLAVDTLLKKISENPAVEGSCYLPMNASVIVHLFKCEESLHFSTQYSIFSALIRNLVIRHLRKNGIPVPSLQSLDELPDIVRGPFEEVCELAYNGVMEDKVIFDVEFSSSLNTLGLLQGVESFAGCGVNHSYNFLHLSIQELLAAFHISTRLKPSKQTLQFKKLLDQPRFNAVFGFYATKTKLQTPGINDVVMRIVGKCTVEGSKREDKIQLVSLLRCLFEAQDPSLCQLVVEQRVKHALSFKTFFRRISGNLPDHISELDLSLISLNPLDCLAIGYFLTSINSDLIVNLSVCGIGAEGCKALFRAEGQVYHITHLKYRFCIAAVCEDVPNL